MEKLLDDDERIRRAEEIYYRRRNGEDFISNKVHKNKKKISIKRMLDIIVICLVIYTIFYMVKNKNYIFTKEFLDDTDKIFNYDIKEKIFSLLNNKYFIQSESISELTENSEKENIIEPTHYLEATLSISEDTSSIDQMKIDAEEIEKQILVAKPIYGEVTSRFGVRDLSNIIVSGFHTGLDIAANQGDDIVSAIDGEVVEVSEFGAYGKHIKIKNNNIVTMYAHCSQIYMSVGDIVNQGDRIAAVGSTGNSTGPHLHFEIMLDDRYIDPEYLLDY